MDSGNRRFEKGFFSSHRFAVGKNYLSVARRKPLFMYGLIVGLIVAVLALVDAFVGRATISAGPLTASHALFSRDCSTCHTVGHGATNAKCLSCHNQGSGDARTFSFARHYEYNSGLVDRAGPAHKEASCSSCHREHRGREATLQNVADANCKSCHNVGSFQSGHPEFEFASKKLTETANLNFPHVQHVREVMDRDSLPEAEAACVKCHVPTPDGRNFQPITFARSCDGCHLGAKDATPAIPLRSAGAPGVITIDQIRQSAAPGTQWAEHWNAAEILVQGGDVKKKPVYHADPWVLENLRRLRKELYPGAELADLLNTTPEGSPRDARRLHREAIDALRAQVEALRGDTSAGVVKEVASLNSLLTQLEKRIEQPFAPFDETRFGVTEADRDTTKNAAEYKTVVDALTKNCRTCHIVQNATIRRVQTDQRSLVRAQFNHRAHITHARCLDCHSVIPMRKYLAGTDDPPKNEDRAEILNLPSIATCRTCHSPSKAASSCTSCHLFHPDKSHLANLTQ